MLQQSRQLAWSSLKVGIVVSTGLIIVFFTIFFLGGLGEFMVPRDKLFVNISDVSGLRPGSPVWLKGVEVGRVKDVKLDEKKSDVALLIKRNVFEYLGTDTRAQVLTMGLLGDKYVELIPGSLHAPSISPGDTITGSTGPGFESIVKTALSSIRQVEKFVNTLDRIISSADTGNRTLARLIRDTVLYTRIERTAQALQNISERIAAGEGNLGKLIADTSLYASLRQTAITIDSAASGLNDSTSTLGMMLRDSLIYHKLHSSITSLYNILRSIEKGKGMAGTVFSDTTAARDLKNTLSNIDSILADIHKNPQNYFTFELF